MEASQREVSGCLSPEQSSSVTGSTDLAGLERASGTFPKVKPVLEIGPQSSIAGMDTLQGKRAQDIWEGSQWTGSGEVLRGAQA